jgi:iron complex transport system substrate-binding protein
MTTELATRVITRRAALTGLVTSLGAAWLTGCSNSASAPSGAGPQAAGTRRIESAHGPVDVPTAPSRVVCTDFYSTYALLDVGFLPAGTAEATVGGVLPSQQSTYDELPKVGSPTEINYEAVAALTPDLILGTQVPGLAADLHEKLSAIAPTLLFAASSPGDWKARAVRAADAVGRGPQGEDLATAYQDRVSKLKTTYAKQLAGLTWALFRATPAGTAFVDGPTSWSGVVLADLGARFTAAAPEDGPTVEIAAERFDALADSDVVLYLANARGVADQNTRHVIEQPYFGRVLATGTRTVPLSSYYAAHYLDGQAVLDQIEKVLRETH